MEIKVKLFEDGKLPEYKTKGAAIPVNELSETERGEKGFGSTGV